MVWPRAKWTPLWTRWLLCVSLFWRILQFGPLSVRLATLALSLTLSDHSSLSTMSLALHKAFLYRACINLTSLLKKYISKHVYIICRISFCLKDADGLAVPDVYCNCVFSDPHEETCWIVLCRSPPVKPSCAVKALAGILMQWHHWSAWTLPISVTSRISGLFPLYFCIHISPGFLKKKFSSGILFYFRSFLLFLSRISFFLPKTFSSCFLLVNVNTTV